LEVAENIKISYELVGMLKADKIQINKCRKKTKISKKKTSRQKMVD